MKNRSTPATVTAVLIGLVFSALIWVFQPINNDLLRNSHIADNYLPEMGVAAMLLLALVVNPLLRWQVPSLALDTRQLALSFAIIIVGCCSTSMIQSWPHALANSNKAICKDRVLADVHEQMKLPGALYLDSITYGDETPVSSQLIDELEEGKAIPWSAWLRPALAWGTMLFCCVVLMTGLALIVFPQWRDNERLPFPLLAVQQALVETPDDGGKFPAIFRSGLFWGGAIAVIIMHGLNGLHHHTGGAFPGFPLNWALYDVFTGASTHIHYWVKQNRLAFIVLGITYFVPNRVAFSIWFTVLVYQFYRMFGMEFLAPFHGDPTIDDHRNGAVLGVALIILWLGRNQWKAVAQAMFRPAQSEADHRNRIAGFLFSVGCLGLFGWQMWAGNSLIYSIFAVVMVILTTLVLARIVAETGLPLMGNSLLAGSLLEMLPIGWLNHKAIFLTNAIDLVIGQSTSRVNAAVAAMHGFGIDKEQPPRHHARLAMLFLAVIVVGMFAAGAVHLATGYRYPGALDSKGGAFGDENAIELAMHTPLKAFDRGSWNNAPYSRLGHTLFGALVAIGLQIGCLLSPLWPFHPAGLLIMSTPFVINAWPSVFLGWAIKRGIVIYGGAKAYRLAKPLFLGLILGEVFSAILWAAVPAILIWHGGDPAEVGRITITR